MQKNKIDVVKAVCNSAARKLAVLSLAATVGCGAVAYANQPEWIIPGLPSTTHGEETPQERLRRLERERDEKRQQADEKRQQAVEAFDYFDILYPLGYERTTSGGLLLQERENLLEAAAALDRQIEDLRAQIESEQQEEPAEEIVEVVPEDEEQESSDEIVEVVSEDEEREEPQHENQSDGTTNTTALRGNQHDFNLQLPELRERFKNSFTSRFGNVGAELLSEALRLECGGRSGSGAFVAFPAYLGVHMSEARSLLRQLLGELQNENQSEGTTNTTALQGLMPNVMNLPEQVMQQRPNQRQTFCGVSLMPLDLSKFYGKK